jgi:hypothetical protein
MKKFFTKMSLVVTFALCFTAMNAQQLWPTADSATIRASQFADTTQIFWQRTGGATPAAGFTGWVSKGLTATTGVVDNSRWVWRRDASANGARYDGGLANIVSPSSANGAAVFNSDLLDSLALGPHSGELISPKMNLTGNNGVIVQLNQAYRNFSSQTLVSYSSDDGVTWTTPININADITANVATANTSVKRIKLTGSVGSANARIKFIFSGRLYFWIVDDIKIFTAPSYELQMSSFYAIPHARYVPKEQADTVYFAADVKNAGTAVMKNVKLTVNVWRAADGARVFTSTTTQYPASAPADTILQNRILPTFLPLAPLNIGHYFGSYRVSGDSSAVDALPGNDTVRFDFTISDTTAALSVVPAAGLLSNYTREDLNTNTVTPAGGWAAGEAKTFRFGNFYRIKKGKGKAASSIVARMNPISVAGKSLLGALYEWKDANGDETVQESERTLVAYAENPIAANVGDANAWHIFRLVDLNTLKLFQMKDETNYLAMVEVDPSTTNTISPSVVYNNTYNYGPTSATWFVADSLDKRPPYSIVLGRNGTVDWNLGGFQNLNVVPCIRLNITTYYLSSVTNLLSDDNKVTIYPNPSDGRGIVTADVDLVDRSSEAIINVMTLDGKYVYENVVNGLHKTQVQLDVSEYAAGMYIFKVTTAAGIMTKRFVVTK